MTHQMCKLGDVCRIFTGGTPTRTKAEYFGGGIPWVKITDMRQGMVLTTDETIALVGMENSSAKLLPVGTVLISIFATIGRTAVLGIEAATNQAIAGVVPHDIRQLDPQFLRFYLDSQHGYLNREARGVAQPNINQAILKSLDISIPVLSEQRRIVDLLSRAEGIVHLRREAEKKAADLIPALFLDMFGDPASNPKGWPVTTIGEIATYTRYGPRFPDRNYAADGAHILRTTDMGYNGELRWFDSPMLPMSPEEIEKYSLREGTLLITRTGATIGKLALFKGAERPCIAGAYLIELGIRDDIVPDFVLHFFLSKFGQSQLVGGSRAVAQPNLNAPTIRSIRMPLPSISLQRTFSSRLAEIESIQTQQCAATAKAKAAFDALLAKCFDQGAQTCPT